LRESKIKTNIYIYNNRRVYTNINKISNNIQQYSKRVWRIVKKKDLFLYMFKYILLLLLLFLFYLPVIEWLIYHNAEEVTE